MLMPIGVSMEELTVTMENVVWCFGAKSLALGAYAFIAGGGRNDRHT